MVGCCEHGKESSSSIKAVEFFDPPSDKLPEKYPSPRSKFGGMVDWLVSQFVRQPTNLSASQLVSQ